MQLEKNHHYVYKTSYTGIMQAINDNYENSTMSSLAERSEHDIDKIRVSWHVITMIWISMEFRGKNTLRTFLEKLIQDPSIKTEDKKKFFDTVLNLVKQDNFLEVMQKKEQRSEEQNKRSSSYDFTKEVKKIKENLNAFISIFEKYYDHTERKIKK